MSERVREKKKQIFQQIWFNLKFSVLCIQQPTLYLRIEWNEMAKIKLNRKKYFHYHFIQFSLWERFLFNNKNKNKKKDDEISFLNQINILYVYHVNPYGVMFDLKNSIPKKKHMDKSNQYGISNREERK